MANSDAAWRQLMADSADALRRQNEVYSEAEHAHATALQQEIRSLDLIVAEHGALKGAFFEAIKKAAAEHGIPRSSLIPGTTMSEVNAFLIEVENEGKRRYQAGVDFDGLRAQGLAYRPR